MKWFRGEGLGAPGVVSDVPRDVDDIPTLSRREADGPPPPIMASVAMHPPSSSLAEVAVPKKTVRA